MSFKEQRERRGLGVGDLARLAGVLPVVVEKIERDEIVQLHLAWSVADALELSQDERHAAYKSLLRNQRDEFNEWANSLGVEVDA